ncbi:MAG: class I SAM-dependent methyltransferase [Cytophagaceae bacterium]
MNVSEKRYKNLGNISIINEIDNSSLRVLDIGCGAGDNARILMEKGKIVDGITLSMAESEVAKNHCRDVFIYNLEKGLPNVVKEREYEVIICSHVLEHICWPEILLNDIYNLLEKTNGTLLVALPNIMHYKFRSKLILGNFDYTPSGTMDNTHFRWYTFKSARQLFINNHFIINKSWVDVSLPCKSLSEKLLPKFIHPFFKNVLAQISPGLFGSQLLYKLRVKEN